LERAGFLKPFTNFNIVMEEIVAAPHNKNFLRVDSLVGCCIKLCADLFTGKLLDQGYQPDYLPHQKI